MKDLIGIQIMTVQSEDWKQFRPTFHRVLAVDECAQAIADATRKPVRMTMPATGDMDPRNVNEWKAKFFYPKQP